MALLIDDTDYVKKELNIIRVISELQNLYIKGFHIHRVLNYVLCYVQSFSLVPILCVELFNIGHFPIALNKLVKHILIFVDGFGLIFLGEVCVHLSREFLL